jgi:nucleoside phosphorylase
MKILIIVAMEKESPTLIEQLGLDMAPADQQLSDGSAKVYHRSIHSHDIVLIVNGKDPFHQEVDCIGPLIIPTVCESVGKFKPDIIINAGTAGAIHAAGAEKHKVYLGSTAMGHDLHFPESDAKHRKLALGNYPVTDVSELAKKLGFERAAISTTVSMLTTEEAKQQLKANQAKLVDMEWKYIVHAILRYSLNGYAPRYMAVKVTTDFIDEEGCPQDQFEKSMAEGNVKMQLAEACQRIIEEICEIKLSKDSVKSGSPSNGSPRFLKPPPVDMSSAIVKQSPVDSRENLSP